jgi:hypothetical protein
LRLAEALKVSRAIQDDASGMTVSRLTLAEMLHVSPSSSVFRELVASSRFYGLTTGGINADEFGGTPLGVSASSADEAERADAYKAAVMMVEPFRKFFETFKNKKVPSATAFKEFLVKSAEVDSTRAEECMQAILADGALAGFIRTVQGSDYVDLAGMPASDAVSSPGRGAETEETEEAFEDEVPGLLPDPRRSDQGGVQTDSAAPRKVFIAHGKNRTPLDQLKKALDQFKVKYAVAVDEPNKGRPISRKVAQLMRDECSSGIFIFTADERLLRETAEGTTEEVWRPSENVVFELGAASILYDNRIVVFKEKSVTFPSDFSDLGYIEFERDQLVAEIGALFSELVGLDVLEVRAKG